MLTRLSGCQVSLVWGSTHPEDDEDALKQGHFSSGSLGASSSAGSDDRKGGPGSFEKRQQVDKSKAIVLPWYSNSELRDTGHIAELDSWVACYSPASQLDDRSVEYCSVSSYLSSGRCDRRLTGLSCSHRTEPRLSTISPLHQVPSGPLPTGSPC